MKRAVGFTPVAYVAMPKQVPNVTTILVYLVNRVSGAMANVTALSATNDGVSSLKAHYVEFLTCFADGREICTNNSPVGGSFLPTPGFITSRFPKVRNIAELCSLHQASVQKYARDTARVMPEPGTELQDLAQNMIRSYERQVSYGMLYRDTNAHAYRPTWKGAFLMTWSQLWPVNAIRRQIAARRAQALQQELQMHAATTAAVP